MNRVLLLLAVLAIPAAISCGAVSRKGGAATGQGGAAGGAAGLGGNGGVAGASGDAGGGSLGGRDGGSLPACVLGTAQVGACHL
jgi:hypothetical protein